MTEPRTVLITGATDGLGRALATRLATEGATLILHGRDPARLAALADELNALAGPASRPGPEGSPGPEGRPGTASRPGDGPRVRTVQADLADLAQVRRLAGDVRAATDRLDVLVSNAGIGSGEPDGRTRRTSADGHELRFAVNYLAGFLLTLDLLPLLRATATAGSSTAGSTTAGPVGRAPARIVNVASLGQHPLDFDDLMLERAYNGGQAYAQSKLAQIMSGFELADRVDPAEITVNSLHPATYMPTKMVLLEVGHSVDALETGVEATHRLVTSPALDGVTGRFFDRQRETRANPQAYDGAVRAALWERSLALVDRVGAAV
ncbi:SDR family NAD(P)-dependent oxidoreductase [Frankia sp. Ag45/Mut15]|uniref:SDR family NAD(P)-dependent oxidoreductase n=1 Tax=Frankia umida TaxID=573489 RepID=A0ABT0JYN7_9ACTN|nr:SDR family NAD(P)-dependent oxidoreductase [Frankia umida]MCK9876660.1 SDR family NAD(P)-dependent oxidoreductase [Frankia umida]